MLIQWKRGGLRVSTLHPIFGAMDWIGLGRPGWVVQA